MTMEQIELLRNQAMASLPNLLIALLTLGLGWVVGKRLTVYWNLRQRRRELDLAAAQEFQSLYGEFFSIWKLWNIYIRDVGPEAFPQASRWDLLERACRAEATMEAACVRLASERPLSEGDRDDLGQFRQAFQSLRKAIRHERPLAWDSSDHPQYRMFKELALRVARLILGERSGPDAARAAEALRAVTSNRWESWWDGLDPFAPPDRGREARDSPADRGRATLVPPPPTPAGMQDVRDERGMPEIRPR